MTLAQYLRIEDAAGGVGCSDRQFIKAAHTLLSPADQSFTKLVARCSPCLVAGWP